MNGYKYKNNCNLPEVMVNHLPIERSTTLQENNSSVQELPPSAREDERLDDAA